MADERRLSTGPSADWTVQAVDTLDQVVGLVRANTVDRLVAVTRLVVLGLVAAVMGTVALVLLAVAAVRLLDIVLPRGVWLPDTAVGGVFTLLGLLLWAKRTPPVPPR